MTLARLVQQNFGVREMVLAKGRSASTISRELRRNAQPAGYASATARACAQQRRTRDRPQNKLHRDGVLFDVVSHFLSERWSPEQIALTLGAILPKAMSTACHTRTSTTASTPSPWAISSAELIATLRHAHNKRVPCSKGQDRRGQIPDMVSIHVRPPEIEDRQFP